MLVLKEIIMPICLLILSALLFILLKRVLGKHLLGFKKSYSDISARFVGLSWESRRLKEENQGLEEKAAEKIALFDISKEICKSLDPDILFSSFKENIGRYLEIGDCKFFQGEFDQSLYREYMIFPLEIDQQIVGYLAAKGVNEEGRDKFYILSQQFLLGAKRVWLYRKLQELAIFDSLTGIFSRRFFLERAEEELLRSKQFGLEFSFCMVDVDYFKGYNDRYGHLVGDVILREVSRIIKENIRQIDLVGRYGGDEFLLILTETDRQEAEFVAERIRKAIQDKVIKAYDEDLNVSVSIGISFFPKSALELKGLIEDADQALYQAKESGRNKVCIFS